MGQDHPKLTRIVTNHVNLYLSATKSQLGLDTSVLKCDESAAGQGREAIRCDGREKGAAGDRAKH